MNKIKELLKKGYDWISESNRWKHLIGGIILGLLSFTPYCAILVGTSVASALEFKDASWGGKWDWTDWSMTVVGVALGYFLHITF